MHDVSHAVHVTINIFNKTVWPAPSSQFSRLASAVKPVPSGQDRLASLAV